MAKSDVHFRPKNILITFRSSILKTKIFLLGLFLFKQLTDHGLLGLFLEPWGRPLFLEATPSIVVA